MRPRPTMLLLLPLLLASVQLPAFDTHPLYLASFRPRVKPAELLDPGELRIAFDQVLANNFIVEELQGDGTTISLELDSEVSATSLSLACAPSTKVELNLELRAAFQYGGFTDPLIEGFHSLFGFPNGSRDIREQNRTAFIIYRDGERILDSAGAVPLSLHLSAEPRFALPALPVGGGGLLSAAVGLWGAAPLTPSVHPLHHSGGWEALHGGIRLYLGMEAGRFTGAAVLGGWRAAKPAFLDPELFSPLQAEFALSAAWRAGRSLSLSALISGTGSPFELDYERTDRFGAVIELGGTVRAGTHDTVTFSFTEEFFSFAVSDIAFRLRWIREIPAGPLRDSR